MARGEAGVETAVDRLVAFVQGRGKTSLRDAARAMGMSEPVIEEIANVLAEQGIIKVRYALMGTFLEPAGIGKAGVEKGIAEAKKQTGVKRLVDEVEDDVVASEREYKDVEEDAVRRMKAAEDVLSRIEREERYATDDERSYLIREAVKLETIMKHFSREVEDIKEEIDHLTTKIYEMENKAQADKSKGMEKGEKAGSAEKGPGLVGGLLRRLGKKK